MLALTAGCSKVPNGFVGVRVNMLGSDEGMQADAINTRASAEVESLNIRGEPCEKGPGVFELNAIEKWNDVMPVYMTSTCCYPSHWDRQIIP